MKYYNKAKHMSNTKPTVFAKILTLENGEQVLVMKDYDVERDMDVCTVRTAIEGMSVTWSHPFELEGERDACFDNYTPKQAQEAIDNLMLTIT